MTSGDFMPEPNADWLAEHDRYLASSAWEVRRAAVLLRDKYRCQARLDNCRDKATQVHHVSYRHWRNEPLFDLISVCWTCHQEITRMDRGQLQDIVAAKEAEHEQFIRYWNASLAARVVEPPVSDSA
jgi:5-methylcytosine-specific restriction endonuclease McrA